jgi:ubiquinone biosynthesis protein
MRLARIAEISKVFFEVGLGFSAENKDAPVTTSAGHHEPASSDTERAAKLRHALERLGPTFIKFGQLLATRVDLFSEDFLRELAKLRCHVPPFPAIEARRIIEQELGREVDQIFTDFPSEPVSAGSIAQVYRAQLRETGEWVAVKVQRPNLRHLIDTDLSVLIEVSRFIDRLVPAYHRSMVHQVASEYAARARQEIDFCAEARAMGRFIQVVANLPEFRVPNVKVELCTEHLLVMEWFDGVLLDQVSGPVELAALGISPRSFATAMLRLQLIMSYEHGFVHGDTHPGNIILLAGAHIGLVDFGLHGDVPRRLCDKMLELLFYQSSGRTDEAVTTFLQIFSPSSDVKIGDFEQRLRAILAEGNAPTGGGSKITAQLVDGLRLGARYQLRAESDLFIVLRNLAIVEGIVLTYCPELEFVPEARKILSGILERRALGVVQNPELRQLLPMALLTLSQRPQLIDRLMRLERSFTEARSLGDFLLKEGVFDHQKPARYPAWWVLLLMCVVVSVLTLVLAWLRP